MKVRTRFAPSPTGYMHIGNLRTALYTYLIARSQGGQFILRIEDTDQERYVEGAVDVIYKTLKMVGLDYDEGPDIGGPYGPYVQSQRKQIYQEYAQKLVELGGAYYCFCPKERLDALREECQRKKIPFKYDGHCRNLSDGEIEKRLKNGEKYVIRQRIPSTGTITFHDEVFGTITVENSTLDEGVLLKSDGLPTYNFANVVDDYLMRITHVVRGSEYLSSTPKYNHLYNAFGWDIPTYIHLPPVMREAGKKLSKRDGDASFEDFYNKGYLVEAIVNYVALLGWSPGDDREFFTLDELKSVFSISGLNKSPAIFDVNKLRWMNGEYIRKKTVEEFNQLALPYYEKSVKTDSIDYMKLSSLLQTRIEVLNDIPDNIDFIDELPEYDIKMYIHKKMKTNLENSLENLKKSYEVLKELEEWNEDTIKETLMELVQRLGVKNGQVLWPIRTAVSGKQFTPGGAIELLDLLGKDESLRRIEIGIEKLMNEANT
ncbi:MAG: glutamate--tRNA ligase [Clostridiales bacterium]|jgi:glutamyl-tRNA synthetase|nr:glutamate--tRNA ligase [Clostridiales bacterium]